MERKLAEYLPLVVRAYAELQGIMESEQSELEQAWDSAEGLLENQFISIAASEGLSRWERILKITPKGTESLVDRRFRILARINEELPYTLPQLRNILETLCGKDNYSIEMEEGSYQLTVKIGLAAKNNFNDVQALLNRVVPQNMVVNLQQLYNTWGMVATGGRTWADLTKRTWKEVKEVGF